MSDPTGVPENPVRTMPGWLPSAAMVRKRKVDRPLRRDVRFLGRLLGEVIVEQEGLAVFELEERVRKLAIRRRRGPREGRAAAEAELIQLLAELPTAQAEPVIRAFAVYFQLVNLAEQHHRIRRNRAHARTPHEPPQRGSLAAVLQLAKERGVPAQRVRDALRTLEVTLTLTAHPTQAMRRTVLDKLDRMANVLENRDRCELTPHEAEHALERVREEVAALWQTDEVRRERPTVGDEVKNVVWYVEQVLWDLIPEVPHALEHAFERAYGEELGFVPLPLRLHSWVGGDMDGNPRVTPEVLEDAIRAHEARGLRRILASVRQLGGALSHSSRHVEVPPALLASLERDECRMQDVAERFAPRTVGEPWRRKLRFIEARLAAGIASVEMRRLQQQNPGARILPGTLTADPAGIAPEVLATTAEGYAYREPAELVADLQIVADTLHEAGASRSGERQVRALLAQVKTLGFHILELEMRAPAEDARSASAWLDGKGEPTEGGARFFAALQKIAAAQRESGESACRTVVLSMASGPEDVRATLHCAREAGLWDEEKGCARIDIVPLFETLQALDDGPAILRSLFGDPLYRRHVQGRGVQEVMVGYSDSGKEVGLLAAHAALRRAQENLPRVAAENGLPLRIFHGRGESVARGGGPAQQAILALPPGSVAGRYKATEQGEALDHKYARPQLAMRTLELIIGGALLHTLDAQLRPGPDELAGYQKLFDELAEDGRKAYRALVWEEPRFVEFFTAASPLEEISDLPIGSRPAKRKAGGVEALRAIPWVFAWTQNRAILPGFYGVGSAIAAYLAREPQGEARLAEMYRQWPAFRTIIDNVEMVLAKSDIQIAARYAQLASVAARDAVWPKIRREHARTRKAIKSITGHRKLLEDNAPLRRSIALRNPYVDPMSFLQVELLRRKRIAGDERCDRPLLLTLSGISAGMRNTG